MQAPPWRAVRRAQRIPPASMRTPYGLSSLVTVAVAMVCSRSSLITPSLTMRVRCAASTPHAEHSFIVTGMKPVVYVLWYQVLP